MFEIADRLLRSVEAGHRIVVATAISIEGSAPRTVGTSMAMLDDGTVVGNISGGCIEGAVYELGQRVLETRVPEVAEFGFDDETAFSVGLSCGGRIRVVTTMLGPDAASRPVLDQLRRAADGLPAELTTLVAGDSLGRASNDPEECRVTAHFTESTRAPARMLVFGATEFAAALCAAASVMGYAVTVCDPRATFATTERFPLAREVVVDWPPRYLGTAEVDERTVICVLSHDDRYDAELVAAALALPVGYVGAMGSRVTHDRRIAALQELGVAGIDRLHSPIGLDVGASTPEETAVSILAEVLAVRTGRSGARLAETHGAIHA